MKAVSSKPPVHGSSGKIAPMTITSGSASIDDSKLQQDLVLLTQKIVDLTGEPQRAPVVVNSAVSAPSSPFVSGIRGITDSAISTSSSFSANNVLDRVLQKIAELDRIVLKKTAPEKKNINVRRGSRGMDLTSLPTHLHITDRLLDLHAQSMRVVTITRNGTTPESELEPRKPPGSPRGAIGGAMGLNNAELKKLQTELGVMKGKHDEAEHDRKEARKEVNFIKNEVELLKKKVAEMNNEISEHEQLESELKRVKGLLQTAESGNRILQEQCEIEASRTQKAVMIIHRKTDKITLYSDMKTLVHKNNDDNDIDIKSEIGKSLNSLDDSIEKSIGVLRDHVNSINTIKECLESDIQTLNTERDMVNNDFLTLNSEHEALKAAYHSLQNETIGSEGAQEESKKKLKKANDVLLEQTAELNTVRRKLMDLEKLPPLMMELETKLRASESVVMEFGNERKQLAEELSSYKKLSNSLKQKIRDLSAKSGADSKDFIDSFEEVMRDEMMTMKAAFEGKLRSKTDEASNMTKRHQMEIQRISQNSSPYIRR